MTFSKMSKELSEVILRVAKKYGYGALKSVADDPAIKAAEATVERACQMVLRKEEGNDVWYGALAVYESTCRAVLDELNSEPVFN